MSTLSFPIHTSVTVNPQAKVEVVNFSKTSSWVRWYLPDFSENGNLDLPEGTWEIVKREGNKLTLKLNNTLPTTT